MEEMRRKLEGIAIDPAPKNISPLDRLKERRTVLLGHLGELDALIARAEKEPELLDMMRTYNRFI